MNRFRMAFVALGVLALTGAAFAAGAVATENFHGVRVIAAETMAASNTNGEKAVATVSLGPYDSDAVVLFDGASQARFDSTKGDPIKLAGLRMELRQNEELIDSKIEKAMLGDQRPEGLRAGLFPTKLFLKRGEVKTLLVAAERFGDVEPAKVTLESNLHVTVIAARQ